MYKKNDYIIIIAIVFSIELFIVFADEVPASDGFEENFLLSGGQYTNLIQTTEDDPNWVLVTSDTILREDLCEPANWYEKVINQCHNAYNRYWKLPLCDETGRAFSIGLIGSGTIDSLFVRPDYRFQLYDNTEEPLDPNDLIPYGPPMIGPKFVSLSWWVCTYPAPNGFEPGTYFVEGRQGGLSQYSIIIDANPLNFKKTSDINENDCVNPSNLLEEHFINYDICYENMLCRLADPNDPDSCVGYDANEVTITDILPVTVDFNSCSNDGAYDPNGHQVVWNIGHLAYEDSGCVWLKVKVNEFATPGGSIHNECVIDGNYDGIDDSFNIVTHEDTSICCYCDTIFVDANATGKNTGVSWENAFTELEDGLDAGGNCGSMQVWVAKGIYEPKRRQVHYDDTFEIPDNVHVFGGFEGSEHSTAQRDFSDPNNKTILNGDTDYDGWGDIDYVVSSIDKCMLDGLTITKGYQANLYFYHANSTISNCEILGSGSAGGNGIESENNSSIQLINCDINDIDDGINSSDSNLVLIDCIFQNNNRSINSDSDNVLVQNCLFENNDDCLYARKSYAEVRNCNFISNDSKSISCSGSEYNVANCLFDDCYVPVWSKVYTYPAILKLENCKILNSRDIGIKIEDGSEVSLSKILIEGGSEYGILADNSSLAVENCAILNNGLEGIDFSLGSLSVRNSIIAGNGRDGITLSFADSNVLNSTIAYNQYYGIDMYNPVDTNISNCIVWGNSSGQLDGCSSTYSCIQYGSTDNGNITDDPCFYDALSDNYHLKSISPCIDKGSPDTIQEINETDIDCENRIEDGDADGNDVIDMGSDEYYYSPADFDLSENVNFFDYAILSNTWYSSSGQPDYNDLCDIEDDNTIDLADLALFCEDWLWEGGWHYGHDMIMCGNYDIGLTSEPRLLLTKGVAFKTTTAQATEVKIDYQAKAVLIKDLLDWLDEIWLNGDLDDCLTYEDYIEFRKAIESSFDY